MNEDDKELTREEQFESILIDLEHIRDMLTEVNVQLGFLQRYRDMRDEITELGWGGILNKYHPDINVDDPAAAELFALYRFVYDEMQRESLE